MSIIETIFPRYAELNEKTKELRKQLKELNTERKSLEEQIQEDMEESGKTEVIIPELNIAIRAKEKESKKAASKNDIIQSLAENMGWNAEDIATNIDSLVVRTRKVKLTIGKVSHGRVKKCTNRNGDSSTPKMEVD